MTDRPQLSDRVAPHPPSNVERSRGGLIGGVVEWSASAPAVVILCAIALSAWGWIALRGAPLDAIPDLSDPQVIILTEWPGMDPRLVEDHVTYPITVALQGAPKVNYVRGQSSFGLSFVHVVFEEGVDLYWARSRVAEQLSVARSRLPKDARSTLGPDATGVGWVLMYALTDETGQRDLSQLSALQDWNIRYALESVSGVAEVSAFGGARAQFQVQLDPLKMRAYGVSIQEVVNAIKGSNRDVGAGTLEVAGHEYMVRGVGQLKDLEDLKQVPLKVTQQGTPLFLEAISEVRVGPEVKRGVAEWNGRGEAVGAVVIMRYGENALDVIGRVRARLNEVRRGLPEGVKIEIAYDRSQLIEASIRTLLGTLLEEMLIVALVIFTFLLHLPSALIPILTLPIAVLLAFIPMGYQALTINIMSLGGIAVAVGAMVDASIILIDNLHKRLEGRSEESLQSRRRLMIDAMREVAPSIFFSLLIITVSFIPVFTLEGVEGRLFRPLAFTKTYAMAFSAILAVTLTPALAILLIRGRLPAERDHLITVFLQWLYTPVVRVLIRYRWWVVTLALLAMLITVPAYLRLKTEFMPPLNEGSILYMPTAPPGMSITEATQVVHAMDRQLMSIPEVVSVLGKMGRADTATDPAPLGMAETTIQLKPKAEWRAGLTWEALIAELDETLQYPGMPNLWWMPIQTRTEMLATGVRSPVAIQIFGDDLRVIEHTALDIEHVLKESSGARSVFSERARGGFYYDVEVKRAQAARYGLSVDEIQRSIRVAIGGLDVTEVIQGRARVGVNLRYARDFRETPQALSTLSLDLPNGEGHIPLSAVADFKYRGGPPMIRSEGGQIMSFVFIDPGNQALGDYVQRAQKIVEEGVRLPAGVRLEWRGQYTHLARATSKLKVILPLTLLMIVCLLFLSTRSLIETLIICLAVPFSLIGAIWILYILDYHLSVAVWVGLIALAGLDAETGVVMMLYLKLAEKRARESGQLRNHSDLYAVIIEGAAGRVRPKLMTVMTTLIGLTPLLWSVEVGADVMKRVAAPMIGGLVSSFILELTVYPSLFAIWKWRSLGPPTETKDVSSDP